MQQQTDPPLARERDGDASLLGVDRLAPRGALEDVARCARTPACRCANIVPSG
ncbi:hypothetical protein ACMHYB_52610 [Sorangium sp. So ce1128]